MVDSIKGWAVELLGQQIDLSDAKEIFADGYHLTVLTHKEDGEAYTLLQSAKWKDSDTVPDIMGDAEQVVREINGALLLTYDDAVSLKTGRIMKWDANGAKMEVAIALAGHALIQSRARGRLTVGGAAVPLPPPARRWIDEADKSDLMSDLLTYIGQAVYWFDLFKAIELAQKIFHDDKIKKDMGNKRHRLWVSARQCANFCRHSKAKQESMHEPELSFDEAKARVVQDIRFMLDQQYT